MKFSKRDLGLILGLIGVLAMVFSYQWVYRSNADKREKAESELKTLQVTESNLKNLEDNMPFYKDEIVRIRGLNREVESHFPRKILPEDEIMYTVDLEDHNKIYFQNVNYGSPSLISTGYEETTGINAYEIVCTASYESTYQGLKDTILYNNRLNNRIVIDTVSATFDSSTGNLEGTMGVNMYYMEGTGETYAPPYVPSLKTGVRNIFGTFENTK